LISLTEPLPNTPEATLAPMFDGYRPKPGAYDEMRTPDGELRPHWQKLVGALRNLRTGDLDARWKRVERILYENGLTHNIYDEGAAAHRPWRLDALPLLISSEDWRQIEAGLIQRARLLDAVLEDCYGQQRLMLERAVPAPLVLGNPQFLRALHGVAVRGNRRLHYYAADLGRGTDGRWRVLKDRCESPVGGGYALENRIALRNCLPDEFTGSRVRQLASFFQAVHDGHVALSGRPDSLVIVLTSGPSAPGYFAHSYLARYQGYVLAEGPDLTVRDDRVFLKTLEGLRQVDVIIRRVEAASCDPLELRSDSPFGIPGLVAAVRAGNVHVVNALGSGVADTEGLMPFLPALCQRLLGEDREIAAKLRVPSLDPVQVGPRQLDGREGAAAYPLACLGNAQGRQVVSGHGAPPLTARSR